MTREKATRTLMDEWKAGSQFRPFFERMVDRWMGTCNQVLESDLRGIRQSIIDFGRNNH